MMKNSLILLARSCFALLCASLLYVTPLHAENHSEWNNILKEAKGQHVFWNAWGGDDRFNNFMRWAGDQVEEQYGVKVTHVKINDTANAVRAVLADKQAGKNQGGKIDLIWINGSNFFTMKKNKLLYGPFTDKLPNFALVSPEKNPATVTDFTINTDGYEAPWGLAQFIIIYNADKTQSPPRHSNDILAYAKKNPGRISYASPPDFTGTSFLKQVLIEQSKETDILSRPPRDAEDAEAVLKHLWAYLDVLHPLLWRQGKDFPSNAVGLEKLLSDGFVDLSFSFNVNAAWLGISQGDFPKSIKSTTFSNGGLSNVNFTAIPYNANAKEGAMILANFLLSPQAQARRQNPEFWGDPSVLDFDKLSEKEQSLFDYNINAPEGAVISLKDLQIAQPEPHPDWIQHIEVGWKKRYAQQS
jgi:putative thiamine transport system substrate-binding protein